MPEAVRRMKAVVREKYGPPDVLHLADVEKPTPKDNEVLVSIRASSINKSQWFELTPPLPMRFLAGGVRKPKRELIGADIAGTVEAVGKDVKQFRPGDEVFGCAHWGYAEYACAREDLVVSKPENVTFEEAAAVPVAAITALQGLRDKGHVQAGQKVLINGASGGVGSFALQIAKSFGAEVTAVCSTKNVDNARAMGADHVIDYTKENFTRGDQKYDLILGVNGRHSIFAYRRALVPGGIYVMVGGSKVVSSLIETMILGSLISRTGDKKLGFMGIAKLNQKDLAFLGSLLESGKLKPFIDISYPLAQTADAFRYFGQGHAHGKVVVSVGPQA